MINNKISSRIIRLRSDCTWIKDILKAKIMEKTRNPFKTRLESADNPLIHYFVMNVKHIFEIKECILIVIIYLQKTINFN